MFIKVSGKSRSRAVGNIYGNLDSGEGPRKGRLGLALEL